MIVIKGKNMPKCCMYCPLFDGEYGTCNIIGETKVDAIEERAKNCPLVEIVACKDCKYNNEGTCYIDGLGVRDDFFCSSGERKE